MSDSPILDIEVKPVSELIYQQAALASQREKTKGTVVLLLDCSSSMGCDGKLMQLKKGSLRFFAEAFSRQYAVGAIGFSHRVFNISGATRNFYSFQKQIMSLEANGRTNMEGAIRAGTWRLRFRRGHKVLMLITDGQPDNPEATRRAAHRARKQGVELIIIATRGADTDFLSSLNPKPELMTYVERNMLEEGIAATASHLG
jgi:Ca-activated chloride channel family protein